MVIDSHAWPPLLSQDFRQTLAMHVVLDRRCGEPPSMKPSAKRAIDRFADRSRYWSLWAAHSAKISLFSNFHKAVISPRNRGGECVNQDQNDFYGASR
jgi:hypothetical protein